MHSIAAQNIGYDVTLAVIEGFDFAYQASVKQLANRGMRDGPVT